MKGRVITRFGFGRITRKGELASRIKLEKPSLGRKIVELNNRSEIFNFSDYAVLMVINAPQAVLSNVQFYQSKEKAREIFSLPWPPDQSCYLLDFEKRKFEMNFQPGLYIQEGVSWQSAWVDRWGQNEILNFPSISEAKNFLSLYLKTTGGTSCGIHFSVLLEMETRKILAYVLLTEAGVTLAKNFLPT
jgi:hypothetical protein